MNPLICFIVCHAGPAAHFATFAEQLNQAGYETRIYASGPALQKLGNHAYPFTLDAAATDQLISSCKGATAIITDVGDLFAITLHEKLEKKNPELLRLAYYDNPEPYVPGGYSETASKVMQLAHRTLFANANLADQPLKQKGIGYYPTEEAETLRTLRKSQQNTTRAQFLSSLDRLDQNQQLLVYIGGNNTEYYEKALPAFLSFLASHFDLSHKIIVIQQHPGAKTQDLDGQQIRAWIEEHGANPKAPTIVFSPLTTLDAQIMADGILYSQTSMAPAILLAGIPLLQVAHATYEDILIRNSLCSSVTTATAFAQALPSLKPTTSPQLLSDLGIREDWFERLQEALEVK